MTPLQRTQETRIQYRGKVVDGNDADVGNARFIRMEAEMDLEDLLKAEPPWQEGYIERRVVSDWERESK